MFLGGAWWEWLLLIAMLGYIFFKDVWRHIR